MMVSMRSSRIAGHDLLLVSTYCRQYSRWWRYVDCHGVIVGWLRSGHWYRTRYFVVEVSSRQWIVPSIVKVIMSSLSGEWNGGLSAFDMFNSAKLKGVKVRFLCHFRQTLLILFDFLVRGWIADGCQRSSTQRSNYSSLGNTEALSWNQHCCWSGVVVCWCCSVREEGKTKLEESRT